MSSLLRSTKFVRYFTGAARTLILNTAKTTEATTLINPKALCAANNVIMRDYATTKKTESLEPLLQRLDAEVRRFGRITKRDIDEVFDEIRARNDITSSQSLLVIRCCGELVPEELPEQRTLLVQKIWNVLTERGIPMDISHYNALLRVYIENEHPFSPAKFLEELETKGLQPNRVTYQRLMWRYCQEGDVEGATKVLEKMRELNFPVSEPVLNALVMGHAFHGDTDGAKAVLQTMAGAGLQPTNRTYTLLACGYAKQGDIEGVKDVIKSATEKDVLVTDKDVLDIIEQLAIGGHGDKADQLFNYLQKSVGYNQDVCNLILKLLNKGQIETSKAIMRTMPKTANIDDTAFKGAFFVKQLVKVAKNADSVVKTCLELKEEGLVPNANYIATETALQLGHAELAQKLFKEIEKEGIEIRQHYYWPLLAKKGKEGDEEGLIQIIRTMSANDMIPSGETLRDYVIPYLMKNNSPQNVIMKLQIGNVPAVVSARNVMVDLLENGKVKDAAAIALQYRLRGQYSLIGRSLLNALSKTKDIDSFVSILHVTSSKQSPNQIEEDTTNEITKVDDKNEIQEVGRLVKTAVKILAKADLVEALLKAVCSKGLRINTESAEAIQQYMDNNMTTVLSELLSKLTSSELEQVALESPRRSTGSDFRTSAQLERILDQIKAKGGNNLARIQKQLLTLYIKENNVPKVDSFLEELKTTEFELTPATLAQLFEFYSLNNEVEKAEGIKTQIKAKYPDFVLNKYKMVVMAEALIKANRFEDAIQYLKDNKPADEAENQEFVINSKSWQLVNYLAEQKDDDKVLQLTKSLIELNYIEPSNVILGPSIKVFLLKDDLDGALKQFEECTKQYRCTPWKGQLMKALIMKEDANKLQWLADLSTQIHGEVNILHDLVLAFVECGRLRQARRILETPGLHTRQRRLEDACVRYVEEGKSEYLEGLLEATKELSHIDRSNIFYHLLVSYCKANETDKAVGLWTILQEESEVPSEQFLTYLGKHLKAKNRPVPFVMPHENKPKNVTVTEKKPKAAVNAPNKPTKNEISTKIEQLINNQRVPEALDMALQTFNNGIIPKAAVLKYLLKTLADSGNVEKIEELSKFMTDNLRKRITFDDKLTLAIINQGKGDRHIESLVKEVEAADKQNIEAVLQKFPRSQALASVMKDDKMSAQCHKIAEIAATQGYLTPINLLWMEYILAGKEKESEAIWNKWLCNAKNVLFRRLLQESHVRNDVQLIEKLINTLETNKFITKSPIGNVYSRLINLHLINENVNEAEIAFKKAIESGVETQHFNKNCIERLQAALKAAGKEFNYSI